MSNFDVCTLQTRHLELKLCTMFKIVHTLTQTTSYIPLFLYFIVEFIT